jgi:hypothetical protein
MIGHPWHRAIPALTIFISGTAIAAPEDEVKSLYEKGVEAYDVDLDFDAARTAFEKALVVIARNSAKVSGPTVAQVKIRAGVLYIAVDKDKAKGLKTFIEAIKADPAVKVDAALLSNPDVDKIYKDAVSAVGTPAVVKPTFQGPILLTHKPPREATTGTPFRIRVELPQGLEATKVYAKYRAPGQTKFTELVLEPLAANAYQSNIPSDKLKRGNLEYFISAEDESGKTLGLSGSSDAPHLVQITGELGEDPGPGPDPDPDPDPDPNPTKAPKRIFSVIVSGGTIAGTVKGVTDDSRTPIAGGFSLPEAAVMPEIAFYATPRLTVGAIGIIQLTNTAGAIDAEAKPQLAGGLRVRYFHGKLEGFRPFISGDGGFGQFVQNFPTGFNGEELGKDSTHNIGPFLGLGWGLEYDFTSSAALMFCLAARGYLADNPVSETTDIPILQAGGALGLRFGK